MASTTSISRARAVSTKLPTKPASIPSTAPAATATPLATTPTSSDIAHPRDADQDVPAQLVGSQPEMPSRADRDAFGGNPGQVVLRVDPVADDGGN